MKFWYGGEVDEMDRCGGNRKSPTNNTYTPSPQIVARRIVPSSCYPPVRAVPLCRQAGTLQCGRSPCAVKLVPSSAGGPLVPSSWYPTNSAPEYNTSHVYVSDLIAAKWSRSRDISQVITNTCHYMFICLRIHLLGLLRLPPIISIRFHTLSFEVGYTQDIKEVDMVVSSIHTT
jgi:hypothetical protein